MQVTVQASAFQRYLAANVARLRPSTTLIITSARPFIATSSSSDSPQKTDQPLGQFFSAVDANIRQCQFFASMQFNLKTVPFGSTLSSAYPTHETLNSALDLMKRMGATNVIGVGNGAALDLAKACYFSGLKDSNEDSELILAPGTLGATMASVSRESIFLNTDEEALFPYHFSSDKGAAGTNIFPSSTDGCSNVTVLVDPKALAIPNWTNYTKPLDTSKHNRANIATIADAALAALAISIDTAHALQEISDERVLKHYEALVHRCTNRALSSLQCIIGEESQPDAIAKSKDDAIHAVLHAGELITFGINSTNSCTIRRNVPLALSSALLPRFFPHGNWITFTASLLPGLISALRKDVDENNEIFNKLLFNITSTCGDTVNIAPSTAFFAEGTPDIDEMINEVDTNGIYLRSNDAKISIFEDTLMSSLNR